MNIDPYYDLLQRMELSGVASFSQLVGCTPTEIAELERTYQLQLPFMYKRYLELMGHKSGRLFAHDHTDASYREALELTRRFPLFVLENERGNESPLPLNALIIATRLDDYFIFIRCSNPDDSPVWLIEAESKKITEIHISFIDWLFEWCAAAEHAIASGYFEVFPKAGG